MTGNGRPTQRYWPWWWQIKEVVALGVGVGVVSVESYRGTYNLAAMGLVAACIGVIAATEYAKAMLRRLNGGNGK